MSVQTELRQLSAEPPSSDSASTDVVTAAPIADRATGQRALKSAVQQCYATAARLSVVQPLDDATVQLVRKYQKWPGRLMFATNDEIARRIARVESLTARLSCELATITPVPTTPRTTLMLATGATPPVITLTASTSLATVEQSRSERAIPARRDVLPWTLDSLPPVELLDDVLTGAVSWSEALRSPRRARLVPDTEIANNPTLLAEQEWRRQLLAVRDVMTARAAVRHLLGETPAAAVRFAQRLYKKAEDGAPMHELLLDGRHRNSAGATVMVPLVKALVLLWYNGRRRIQVRQITQQVRAALVDLEVRARADGFLDPFPDVNEETVQKFVRRLPPALKSIRTDGMAGYARQSRLVAKIPEAVRANQIWEIDHSPVDLWAVLLIGDELVVVRMWATACIDAYSGLPLSVYLDTQPPTAYTTSLVLRDALTVKQIGGVAVGGLPEKLIMDRGRDFMSTHVQMICAALGITAYYAGPRRPDEKPHIERFFRTLNESYAQYPGYTRADGMSETRAKSIRDRLLTVRTIKQHTARFRDEYAERDSDKREGSPLSRFAQTASIRTGPDDVTIDLLLLKSDETRILRREGIEFRKRFYVGDMRTVTGHGYAELAGRPMVIRYHPDIDDFIIVFDAETNLLVGEFQREDLVAPTFTREFNKENKLALLEVTREYEKKLHRMDREHARLARAAERAQLPAATPTRQLLLAAPSELATAQDDHSSDVQDGTSRESGPGSAGVGAGADAYLQVASVGVLTSTDARRADAAHHRSSTGEVIDASATQPVSRRRAPKPQPSLRDLKNAFR